MNAENAHTEYTMGKRKARLCRKDCRGISIAGRIGQSVLNRQCSQSLKKNYLTNGSAGVPEQ